MGVIIGLIIAGVIIYLYVLAVIWFFNHLALYVFGIAGLGFMGVLLYAYGQAVYEGFSRKLKASLEEAPIPPEPAYKNYFFRKAYYDYADIVKRVVQLSFAHGKTMATWNLMLLYLGMDDDDVKWVAWIVTWPVFLTLSAVILAGFAAQAVLLVVFSLFHLLIVVSFCTGAYLVALYLRLVEWISMMWRRIFFACPHCYESLSLPVYVCPNCGAQHKKLVPGPYGIIRRRCQCGYHGLRTSGLLGRRALQAHCPKCSRPLSAVIGQETNVHLPIVGGPATGKTSFLVASVIEMMDDSRRNGRTLDFPNPSDAGLFKLSREQFERGHPPLKTAELSPSSFLLEVKEPSGSKHLIFIYDAAGELYGQEVNDRRRHNYFSYIDGILFLVDPFSVQQVSVDYQDRITSVATQLKPSAEAPQNVYDRMITTFRDFWGSQSKMGNIPLLSAALKNWMNRRRLRRIPLAVLLTKVDALGVKQELAALPQVPGGNGQGSSPAVRQWLLDHGEGNLVRCFEKDFQQVQYYACSALGHLPDSATPFRPEGVLPPLKWALKNRDVRITGEAERGFSFKSQNFANGLGVAVASLLFSALLLGAGSAGKSLFLSQADGSAGILTGAMARLGQSLNGGGKIVDFHQVGGNQLRVQAFRLPRQAKIRLKAQGELFQALNLDYAWIENLNHHRWVWGMNWNNTKPAGGADKNRKYEESLTLPPGDYAVYFRSNHYHHFGNWNSSPPKKPAEWGIQVRCDEAQPLNYSVRKVVDMTQVHNKKILKQSLKVPVRTRFWVYSLGEYDSRGMFDHAWIEDALTYQMVWESNPGNSSYAGGAQKNQVFQDYVTLNPGTYNVCYRTDVSHSWEGWNANAPVDAPGWGIQMWALGANAGAGLQLGSVIQTASVK
ncbi:MAG: hypothetical protein C4524_11700 [Candidatus Zixiibacteriota bacterium]|nr:MAG: hypothetical protein C4524_11700 [candidate division Zixibacteria bacterium]